MNRKDPLTIGNILKRMGEPTPPFWKKVRNTMYTIGAVGAIIIGLPITVPGIIIPAAIASVAGYMVSIGAVGAALAESTSTER